MAFYPLLGCEGPDGPAGFDPESMASYYADGALFEEESNDVWITKAGEAIRICDLSDVHLMNIVRMLRRKNQVVRKELRDELTRRKLRLGKKATCAER